MTARKVRTIVIPDRVRIILGKEEGATMEREYALDLALGLIEAAEALTKAVMETPR